MLIAANQFQVNGLVAECAEFLYSRVTDKNMVETYMKIPAGTPEYEVLLRMIDTEFKSASESEGWLSLSEPRLDAIVRRDTMTVKSEMDVFRGIVRWARHQQRARRNETVREIATALLAHVRWLLLDDADLGEVAAAEVLDTSVMMQLFTWVVHGRLEWVTMTANEKDKANADKKKWEKSVVEMKAQREEKMSPEEKKREANKLDLEGPVFEYKEGLYADVSGWTTEARKGCEWTFKEIATYGADEGSMPFSSLAAKAHNKNLKQVAQVAFSTTQGSVCEDPYTKKIYVFPCYSDQTSVIEFKNLKELQKGSSEGKTLSMPSSRRGCTHFVHNKHVYYYNDAAQIIRVRIKGMKEVKTSEAMSTVGSSLQWGGNTVMVLMSMPSSKYFLALTSNNGQIEVSVCLHVCSCERFSCFFEPHARDTHSSSKQSISSL
jgi:hypothetical protein